VGYGRLPAAEVVRALRGEEAPDQATEGEPEAEEPRGFFRRMRRPASAGLRVSGQSDVLVRFGQCCSPLAGDEVVGFVTRGRGVTVHVKDCSKVFELDPARRIDVQWEPDAAAPRRIRIRLHSVDAPGLLAKVTKTISAAGVNIGAARVTTSVDGRAIHTFDLWVTDLATLRSVMKQIERVRGVHSVERLRT